MKKTKYNWDNVNWLEQDIVIARQMGCSRERVRQKRLELGKKRSPHHQEQNRSIKTQILNLNTKAMTLDEIAKKMDCTKIYIKNLLKQYNAPYIVGIDRRKLGKYRWEKANYKMSDRCIAFRLNIPNPGTVAVHRLRLGIRRKKVTRSTHRKK